MPRCCAWALHFGFRMFFLGGGGVGEGVVGVCDFMVYLGPWVGGNGFRGCCGPLSFIRQGAKKASSQDGFKHAKNMPRTPGPFDVHVCVRCWHLKARSCT